MTVRCARAKSIHAIINQHTYLSTTLFRPYNIYRFLSYSPFIISKVEMDIKAMRFNQSPHFKIIALAEKQYVK